MKESRIQFEQPPVERYTFRVSDRLTVDLVQPDAEEPKWTMVLTIAGDPEISFTLNELLPEGVSIRAYHTDTMSSFGYTSANPAKGIENKFTLPLGVFERDPKLAVLATLHEAGHSVDAQEHPELYQQNDTETSPADAARAEIGANVGLRSLLATIHDRFGVELVTAPHAEQFITRQLLGYQVGHAFREEEKPQFLHLSYEPEAWARRQAVLAETLEDYTPVVESKTQQLWDEAVRCRDEHEFERLVFTICGDVPFVEESRRFVYGALCSNLLDDRLHEDEGVARAKFRTFIQKIITSSCKFIAHERLLTQSAREGLQTILQAE